MDWHALKNSKIAFTVEISLKESLKTLTHLK